MSQRRLLIGNDAFIMLAGASLLEQAISEAGFTMAEARRLRSLEFMLRKPTPRWRVCAAWWCSVDWNRGARESALHWRRPVGEVSCSERWHVRRQRTRGRPAPVSVACHLHARRGTGWCARPTFPNRRRTPRTQGLRGAKPFG